MRWTENRSDNVEDRRGLGGGRLVGGGLISLIIAAVVFFLGGDPSSILSSEVGDAPIRTEQRQLTNEELQTREFIRMLSAENDITWNKIFQENGMEYRAPKIVIFEETTQSGCGTAQSEMGPFYCPNDEKIYMDLSFFNELQSRFGAQVTEFTVAYVLGHEVGHHIQKLLGTLQKTEQLRTSGRFSEAEINRISVATELQADFYAGLWSRYTDDRAKILEPKDIDAALSAAAAVGDDNIMKRSQGYVNQEAFTHGSSEQRKEWFLKGYTSGDIRQGNTFDQLLR